MPYLMSILPSGDNAHGTMMAGLAAASANNGFCGVGVAYDAFVSGVSSWLFGLVFILCCGIRMKE